MNDGSIRVGTKLDTKETEIDLKKLEKECEKTAQKIEQAGAKIKTVFTGASKGQLNSAFKTANKELEKTEAALAAVEDKIKEIQAKTDKMLPEAATDSQTATLLAMEESESAPLLQQREELAAKAADYRRQMEAITAEINRQTQAEMAQKALKTTGKQSAADAEWLSKIKTQEQYNTALSTTQAKMAAIERQAAKIAQETGVAKDKLLQQDAEYQKLSRRLSLLTTQAKKFGDTGANAGKKTSREMSKSTKAVNAMGTALKQGIKKVGKLALAVIGIRAAYNAVRRAADAYLQDNENLKKQLESLWNIAGQAIGPFVEAMVKGISTVVAWVSSLIKALTGVDLVAKANAAALKKQANATKEASKAAQLAGFDEINKLNDNSSSGGDSAATFDNSLVGKIPNFMEEIKRKILGGDWFGAGETLGKSLMKGIENINWYKVGYTIGDTIVSAAQFVLGFLLELDPKIIIGSVNDFLGGLFTAIAHGIEELDWKEIGGDILDLLLWGLLGTLAVMNPALGIIMFMLTPNSDKLASGLFELAGSIIGALAAALVGAAERLGIRIKDVWKVIKKHFDNYVDWEGTPGDIVSGLLEGIWEGIKNIGKWIKDNVWVPFRDGFKKAFGIASPSKEMKTLGGYIVDGLILGIGNVWTKIKSKFDDAKAKLGEWGDSLKTRAKTAGTSFVDGLKSGLDTLKTKIKEPINALISMLEKALNWIIGKLNTLSFSLPSWIPEIGGKKFGINISKVSIPRLAKGGIVNNPGRGVPVIAGEAGKEAVLPLENNTEWMDTLADKIRAGAQRIVIPIYLNGRKIAEEIIDLTKQRNFATNGAI